MLVKAHTYTAVRFIDSTYFITCDGFKKLNNKVKFRKVINAMQTVNLLIKGKVQGVYYRNAAKEEADKSGVTGWVKYISEGRVEAMASGNEKQLQKFIEWCRRGPEKAIVTDVIITPLSWQKFNDFTVILEDYPHDI